MATVRTRQEDEAARKQATAAHPKREWAKIIWQDELPAMKAMPLSKLQNELAAGHAPEGGVRLGEGATRYLVEGTLRILADDTSRRAGLATVHVEGAAESVTALLRTGPLVFGTDLRDVVTKLSLDDFDDQIGFGNVASLLNARVEKEVLAEHSRAGSVGASFAFRGVAATTMQGPLLLTPVVLRKVTP